jgi:hypothetical protein
MVNCQVAVYGGGMIRLAGSAAVTTLASFSLVSTAAGVVPTAKPMVGNSFPAKVGFGQVKPTRLGWAKPGLACHIHWDSWGGQIALGTGVGYRVSQRTYKAIPSAVVVYLYDLKTVHGKPAYTALGVEPVPTKHSRPLKPC